jgi:hypothetical protein
MPEGFPATEALRSEDGEQQAAGVLHKSTHKKFALFTARRAPVSK